MDIPMMNEINENTNAAKNEILEAMPAAGATSAEVTAAKDAILAQIAAGGCIKRVQRGATAMNGASVDISISAVDMNKSFVLVQPWLDRNDKSFLAGKDYPVVGYLASANKVRLRAQDAYNGSWCIVHWEVVEFY